MKGRPHPTDHPTAAFDYPLPADRIAQHPTRRRDDSRLLVLHRHSGRVEHRSFRDLVDYADPGDLFVLNETRVVPARLVGRKPTGAAAEILLLRPEPDRPDKPSLPAEASPEADEGRPYGGREGEVEGEGGGRAGTRGGGPEGADPDDPYADAGRARIWRALVRPGGKLKPGRVVEVGPDLRVEILDSTPDGGRVVRLDTSLPVREALERWGRVPLPPYIEREPEPSDAERYQTVYARRQGSVAAPTAGLHFTPAVLDALRHKEIGLARLVLHVGVGTFRPVEEEDPGEHAMHAEWFEIGEATARAIAEARVAGGKVWAVGTTVARALESAVVDGRVRAGSGWTRLFIRPPYRFHAVDRLVTNFHLPRSTLLMLVAAFGGYEAVMAAYREAVARGYRFYSYGDAMVLI